MSAVNLPELNKAFKAKWIDVINKKSSLYEIESKIAALHKTMLNSQLQVRRDESMPNIHQTVLAKRPPQPEVSAGAKEESSSAKKTMRFPKDASKVLREWFYQNIDNPYPEYIRVTYSYKTKLYLSKVTTLSLAQIQNWFINARKRNPADESPKHSKLTYFHEPSLDEQVRIETQYVARPGITSYRPATAGLKQEDPTSQASHLATFEAGTTQEGSLLPEIRNIISHPKRLYDDVDVSEAIIFDDIESVPNQSNKGKMPNFYNVYLNNAVSFLNQEAIPRVFELDSNSTFNRARRLSQTK